VPKRCRSRYAFLAVIVLWFVASIAVVWLLPQRPVPRIGIGLLLSAAAGTYIAWHLGWRRFLREILPCVVIGPAAGEAHAKFRGLFGRIGDFLLLLLIVAVALLLWSFFLKLIGVGGDGDATGEETIQSPDTGPQARP